VSEVEAEKLRIHLWGGPDAYEAATEDPSLLFGCGEADSADGTGACAQEIAAPDLIARAMRRLVGIDPIDRSGKLSRHQVPRLKQWY